MTFDDGILTDEQRAQVWNLDAANAQLAADVARISRDRYLSKLPTGISHEEMAWYRAHKNMQLSMVNAIERNNAKIESLFNEWLATSA